VSSARTCSISPRFPTPRDLMYVLILKNLCMRCSSAKWCKKKTVATIVLFIKNVFTKILQAFLFIRNLANHSKTNNIRFMNLTKVYDFLQVLGINTALTTKDDYFSKQE
jgi:hypothetical protein